MLVVKEDMPMYASVRRARGSAEAKDQVAQIVRDEMVPKLGEIEGFVAYYVVDAGGGELITISIFEDQAGVEESARQARELVAHRLQPFMQTSLEVSNG